MPSWRGRRFPCISRASVDASTPVLTGWALKHLRLKPISGVRVEFRGPQILPLCNAKQ
jgi:hypothetical protein